jgi:hypothetical protein
MKFAIHKAGNLTSRTDIGMLSARLALLLLLSLLCLLTRASTSREDEMFNTPMRHQSGGASSNMVLVHMTRLQGHLESPPGNTAKIATLKHEVQKCVEDKQKHGQASNPPKAWPDFSTAMRTDTYAANNRKIAYITVLSSLVNYTDCSLTEVGGTQAILTSLKGKCLIDIAKMTARGQCDALAHADAPVRRYKTIPKLPESDPMLKKIRSDPAYAAMERVMDLIYAPSQRKTILGLECDTAINPAAGHAIVCLSRGGSFATCDSFNGPPQSCMQLESITKEGQTGEVMNAVEARLDTHVDASIFAPYLVGGFEITHIGEHK